MMVPSFFALMACLGARLFLPAEGQPDVLPAPTIFFVPENTVYILQESVTIQCQAPSPLAGITYRFFKDGNEINRGTEVQKSALLIQNIDARSRGSYFCLYERELLLKSMGSTPIELFITTRPQTPSVSFQPPDGGTQGARVVVKCNSPEVSTINGYRFYKDGQELTEPGGSLSSTFIIPRFMEASVGEYVCLCWRVISGREIRSSESRPAYLTSPGIDNLSNAALPVFIQAQGFNLILFGGKLMVLTIVAITVATY